MVRDRDDLEPEIEHVGAHARLHDLLRIDVVVLAVGEPALEEAGHAAQRLKE
jgi:hypothetical protein